MTDFVCGTRRVIGEEGNWRVVCATCGAGGTVRYTERLAAPGQQSATSACIRDSGRPCRACGAS